MIKYGEFAEKWRWTIQVIEAGKSLGEAQEMLESLKLQDGFLAGRIIGDGHHSSYAAQAFFEDSEGHKMADGWLPDGMKRVFTPSWLLK